MATNNDKKGGDKKGDSKKANFSRDTPKSGEHQSSGPPIERGKGITGKGGGEGDPPKK